jgi:hypothetical protein
MYVHMTTIPKVTHFHHTKKKLTVGADGVTKYQYQEIEMGFQGSGMFDKGYFESFDNNVDEASERLEKLRANKWIDAATQMVRIEFVAYNPNTGMFTAVQFKTEFDNTGVYVCVCVCIFICVGVYVYVYVLFFRYACVYKT